MNQRPSKDQLLRRYEARMASRTPAPPAMLKTLPVFALIPEKIRDGMFKESNTKLLRHFNIVDLQDGEYVLREGEYSDSAYYILEGVVEVVPAARGPRPTVRGGAHNVPVSERQGTRPKADAMLGRGSSGRTLILSDLPGEMLAGGRTLLEAGEIFGEVGALSRYAVSADVRAASQVRLLQIGRPALRTLTAKGGKADPYKGFREFVEKRYRERTLGSHLRNVELFSQLDDATIEALKNAADLVSFEAGNVIVEEGTTADSFLLVRGGYVKVSVRASGGDLAVTYLRKGDYAGEAALLLDESWPFTLQALDYVELVKLPKDRVRSIVAGRPEMGDRIWKDMIARLKARGAVSRNPTSAEYVQMAMETGLIRGESVLLIDLSTCTRCDDCVRGCADAHDGEPRFVREGQKYRNWLIPMACYQCTDPVCIIDCPTGSISREVGTLEVQIDEPTCIGCGNCVKRCPWGNIVLVPQNEKRLPTSGPTQFGSRHHDTKFDGTPGVATKCDHCIQHPEGPACVQMCPHGAAIRISFKDVERVTATLK